MRQVIANFGALIVLILSQDTWAANNFFGGELQLENGNLVKDRYIVRFKDSTQHSEQVVLPPSPSKVGSMRMGESANNQSTTEIAQSIGLRGEVLSIFASINSIYVQATVEEMERLARDPRVLYISQDAVMEVQGSQSSPGWALDRLDESTPATPDSSYTWTYSGYGQTIYILDSGLNLGNTNVANEFDGRANIFYDVQAGNGYDCNGHGTSVASAAGGELHGTAKAVTLEIVRITALCDGGALVTTAVSAFEWLALNETAGTIVNFSFGVNDPGCQLSEINRVFPSLEEAIINAHDAGILVVVGAGNSNCDTANYTPSRIAEAFVVGGVFEDINNHVYDFRSTANSNYGDEVDTWAPSNAVQVMHYDGTSTSKNGTSFASPYIAGIMAIACEWASGGCESGYTSDLYEDFKDTGSTGTVYEFPGGSGWPLLGNGESRFIWQQW